MAAMPQTDALNGKPESALVAALGVRSIVLVGMMGAGKSSIGRRLATRLGIPFVDADSEIDDIAAQNELLEFIEESAHAYAPERK